MLNDNTEDREMQIGHRRDETGRQGYPDGGMSVVMKRDVNAIVTLLATQSMIHLGEIPDPISGATAVNFEKAALFLELIEELGKKTTGNLTQEEESFLNEVLTNLSTVYQKKDERGK